MSVELCIPLSSGLLDMILISSLWERFDREVRHCPSREDKTNWDSTRMKTILFSWNRKYIIIRVGLSVVLAPVLVQVKIYIPWWDVTTETVRSTWWRLQQYPHQAETEPGLTGCCSWLSDLELGTSQSSPTTVHSPISPSKTGLSPQSTPGRTGNKLTKYHHKKDWQSFLVRHSAR